MVKIRAVERYKHATAWLHPFDECFKCGSGIRRDHQNATGPNDIETLVLERKLHEIGLNKPDARPLCELLCYHRKTFMHVYRVDVTSPPRNCKRNSAGSCPGIEHCQIFQI